MNSPPFGEGLVVNDREGGGPRNPVEGPDGVRTSTYGLPDGDQAELGPLADGGHPAGDAQLAVDVVEMGGHRALAETELAGDLPGGETLGRQGQDRSLSLGDDTARPGLAIH